MELEFVEKEMTDHECAKWLEKNNWAGPEKGCHKYDTRSTMFMDHNKQPLAVIFYNNAECTRKIMVRKDLV